MFINSIYCTVTIACVRKAINALLATAPMPPQWTSQSRCRRRHARCRSSRIAISRRYRPTCAISPIRCRNSCVIMFVFDILFVATTTLLRGECPTISTCKFISVTYFCFIYFLFRLYLRVLANQMQKFTLCDVVAVFYASGQCVLRFAPPLPSPPLGPPFSYH